MVNIDEQTVGSSESRRTRPIGACRGRLTPDRRFPLVRTVEGSDGPRVTLQYIRDRMRDDIEASDRAA